MAVRPIVPNIAASSPHAFKVFYGSILGLDVMMDQGWIVTFGSNVVTSPQISVASQGGSDTPVPDISIEVDNLDEVLKAMREAGHLIEYGPQH